MMNAPIEGQQEFERVVRARLVDHIISRDDMYLLPSLLSRPGRKEPNRCFACSPDGAQRNPGSHRDTESRIPL
jgi:hypothetical protein